MAHSANNTLIALALLAAFSLAEAQSLGEPAPVGRVMDVTQFGVPRDAKLIFCDEPDCPTRTVKTLTSPKPPALPARSPAVSIEPQPQSVQTPAVLSPAKVVPPEVPAKKAAPKKRRVPRHIDCRPH